MAFKSSPVAIVISRRDTGAFLDTNEAFLRTFSYTREAVIGRSAVQFGMVSGDEFATMRNEVLAAPTLIDRERILRTGTGERVSVLASSELITLGGVACTLTTMIDITARKLAQDALRESEERLRLFILFAPAALAMFDRQMRYLAVSNRWLDDYGLGGRELLGLSHYEVFPEIGERWRAIHRRGFAGEVVRSEADRFERADGQVQWLKWEVRPWHDATGAVGGIVVFSEDITAQRQAKEQLQLHQAILEETGRIAKVGGWTFDVVTGAGTWTDEVARIHDLDPSAATSLNVGLSYYTETSRPKIEAAIRAAIDQAISYDLELELLSAKGVRKWVRTIGHPVVENGRVVRVNGSFQDITEQKKLEAQFLRGQRMEAIGTLASGVAHDLNNILSPMLMVAGLLKDEVGTKEGRAALGLVETSAHRGAAIIKQLLLFGRGHDGEKVVVAPVHLIKEMVGIARETFPREIGIIEKAPRDLWPVIGDPTQLHQVLLNLCVNARDAMRQGGRLILGGRNVTFDATSAPAFPDAKPGRYTLLTVEDTGEGIPAEIIARIFDPFFTTKELGRGTGLGLSTVQNIVKGHQGFVSVYSEAGRGTVFNVYLPAADAEAKPRGIDPGPTSVAGKQELILVVDDEAPIREAMRILLRKQGYRVLLAENGSDALSVFLENQNSIRLVITDVMMPVMGGVELTRRLRALHPALPIIATTGLEETTKQEELAEFGVVDLLPKPLELADLMDRIRRRLA
jgi:PAS domain S-box-containing protein